MASEREQFAPAWQRNRGSHWRLEGVALSAEMQNRWPLSMRVQAYSGVVVGTVMNPVAEEPRLLADSTIQVTGNCVPSSTSTGIWWGAAR